MENKRRNTILDSYLSLGQTNGFANVSLSQISSLSGISKATVFSHFRSKEELEEKALQRALGALSKAEFAINFKASDKEELFEALINSFIDIFTVFPVSALLSYAEQQRLFDSRARKISRDIDKIISSRLLVALDYCVQRSWSASSCTDDLALALCPFVRSMICGFTDEESLIDCIIKLV